MREFAALPQGFVWGAATSAYQIEGAVDADGRKPSIWDTFCRVPGAIDNGDTGDVAADHYHRVPEDVALMKRLGLDAYRFSIAWPRVMPDGRGQVNAAGLDFYDRLVDQLLAAGVKPFATLYHWDLPQALQDLGGWPERDTAYAFADYAAVVAARLGDRVTDWMTMNEPLCSAWIGHLDGNMAPGERSLERAIPASHHLLLGHGLGMAAIRAHAATPAEVGIVLNLSPIEPASDSPEDVAAAHRADGHTNRWWLDPVFGRGYPTDMVETYKINPPVRDGDLEAIAAPTEFFGLNYYFRQLIADAPDAPAPHGRQVPVDGAVETAMGWEVFADGLEQLLLRVTNEYHVPKIYVTENGSAWADTPGADGAYEDKERTRYLEDHLAACASAVAKGAPLAGYFAWSLLDNFEWAYGYDKRFGLVHVDYDTQVRTIKNSGHRYAEIIRNHRAELA
ncbi:GH1 family beta-glucosidase [Catenuloplanes japonicus]|uniref:GH1 family beta-glucosidase n=1 Tax=Catenuloplanes japonicus TaxID=33876 RepID=UPI000525021F|nr:GH1 family beta-glucosidase [Catenuloplanes japonicus]